MARQEFEENWIGEVDGIMDIVYGCYCCPVIGVEDVQKERKSTNIMKRISYTVVDPFFFLSNKNFVACGHTF